PAPGSWLADHWNTANSAYLDATAPTYVGAIALSPTAGPVGSSVAAQMSKFPPGVSVTLLFDQVTIGAGTTDGSGAVTIVFPVPVAVAGGHVVVARTSSLSVTATFKITPSLTASPRRSRAGRYIDVSAAGFGAGEAINFIACGEKVLRAAARQNGSLDTTIHLPKDAGEGKCTLTARGDSGREASTTLTIITSTSSRRKLRAKSAQAAMEAPVPASAP
ncbi:MAG: hypothetical protein ACR2J8_10230, partial [Thermomicrobiales bacterium]